MNKVAEFDVLIVYNSNAATSSGDEKTTIDSPFSPASDSYGYNEVYAYFLTSCQKIGIKAAFSTSSDIIGAGLCKTYWTYKKTKWHKNKQLCHSNLIFDKFSPINKSERTARELLFSDNVKSYNSRKLFNLFFDKQKTYQALESHAIPTITLDGTSIKTIKQSCNELNTLRESHPRSSDFSDQIVMKDRYGAGGNHVYKFNPNESRKMYSLAAKHKQISFIIQPFAKFDRGFSFNNQLASTDIRLVYLGGEIVQSYIRTALPNEFRCNEHQGGTLTYLDLKDLPKSLIAKSNSIATILEKKSSLYSLDFIMSNSGNPYFLEGNSGPGLDWNTNLKSNERNAKKLIRLIAKQLLFRSDTSKSVAQI